MRRVDIFDRTETGNDFSNLSNTPFFPPCFIEEVVVVVPSTPITNGKGESFNFELVSSALRAFPRYVALERRNKVFHYLSTSCGVVGTKEQWDKSAP